ncbi:extracellular matrix protein 1 isoform 2-T2 [Pholidichthys leucotaenia]
MAFSWVRVSSALLVLSVLSSASREMQLPDPFLMQEEADLTDLLDPKEFPIEQIMVSPPENTQREQGGSRSGVFTPRGRRPNFVRSSSDLPVSQYPVQFPLGRPTVDNLQAICEHSAHRPRYPQSYFPVSGFGVQKLRATAVNNAEYFLNTCCKGNQTWEREVTLCCATQAWLLFVDSFCEEDSSIKHPHYHCCKLQGSTRQNCFSKDAPNPTYGPTEELPVEEIPTTANFSFDPDTCQSARDIRKRVLKKPTTSQKIHFPLGQPTADNFESLCANQKQRPIYNLKCLPSSGAEMLARQAKAINRMEKGFKQCCKRKKGGLSCAHQKWRGELKKFCLVKKRGQEDFPCCTNSHISCFKSMSPDPHYNLTSATESISLSNVCDTHKMISKRFPVEFPLKTIVNQCCPLPEEDRTGCTMQKFAAMPDTLCMLQRDISSPVHRCCQMHSQGPQCLAEILKDAITKATNVLNQKKRKVCPIS